MSDAEGARIPDPGFAGDAGEADPRLARALAAYDGDRAAYVEVLAALQAARLLVPVVAVLGEAEIGADGLARDKSSDMATVLVTRPDGRRGLLAFTSLAAMARWDAEARPVPVTAQLAARAAVQEGAEALVVDLAGPVRVAVEGEDLRAVAAGWRLARLGERRTGWIRPAGE